MKIAVACGGTGGHIFPGLATARVLRERGHEVTLWLAGKGVESSSTAGWDGRTVVIRASGFEGGLSVRQVGAAVRMLLAVGTAWRTMRRERPAVLLAMGSFASVAPVLAARLNGVRVVLHEANAVPGRAVALLSRFADAVGVGFAQARERFRHGRVAHTGFPVRQDLDQRFADGVVDASRFRVLLFGGSQGAHRLNEIGVEAFRLLKERGAAVQVIHLTGRNDEAWVRAAYEQAGVAHRVYGFLKEMGAAYQAADLAIARSGAATCAELAICGVPACLVPFPHAQGDHQLANARIVVAAGAADLIEQKELTAAGLADYILACIREPERLDTMRRAMKDMAVPDAAAQLADLVESVGNEQE